MAESFDDFIELLRRNTDENGWLQPLLDDQDSYAVLGAQVQIFARLSPAVDHNGAQATISGASGGQSGTSNITITRAASGTTGTIPKGYTFTDERGIKALLTTDVAVGGGVTTLVLPVQTLRQTELVNTEDDPLFEVDPGSATIPASAGILIAPPGTGGMTSTTFQAIGPSDPIAGGAADYLSVHGGERGLQRQPGESETAYRQRIRNIPDVVTPIAVSDSVQQAAQALGLPPLLTLEPFNLGETPALKTLHHLASFSALFLDDPGGISQLGSFCDDPSSGLFMLDRRLARAYFEIVAQDYVTDGSGGIMFLDDGAFLDDPVLGYPFAVPSFPQGVVAAFLALADDVQAKKAGGVQFDILLRPPDTEVGHAAGSGALSNVWTLTPAGGKIWSVLGGCAGHDSLNPDPGLFHHIVFDLEDGSHLTTADYFRTDTQRLPMPGQRVTAVHGWTNASASEHLVGWVDVIEETL